MRLCTYRVDGGTRLGEVVGDAVWPLDGTDVADALMAVPARTTAAPLRLAEVELAAPLVPGTVLAVGRNYAKHAAELRNAVPDAPVVFIKHRGAITAPGGPVVHPGAGYTRCLDYEVELAVVVGRRAWRVTPADALGMCSATPSSTMSAPRPPELRAAVAAGEGRAHVRSVRSLGDHGRRGARPAGPRARTWINDELRQDASTGDQLFGVADIIAWCSASFVLEHR